MNTAISSLGMAKRFRKRGNIFQVEFYGGCLRRGGEFPAQRIKILQRLVVIHFSQSEGRARMRRTLLIPCGARRRREIRVRAEIPSAEILPAISAESFARSHVARQIQSARLVPRYLDRPTSQSWPSRRPWSDRSKSKCTAISRHPASR